MSEKKYKRAGLGYDDAEKVKVAELEPSGTWQISRRFLLTSPYQYAKMASRMKSVDRDE